MKKQNSIYNFPFQPIMIPITLKTPCRSCGVVISASSIHDLRNHICAKDKNIQVGRPDKGRTWISFVGGDAHQ